MRRKVWVAHAYPAVEGWHRRCNGDTFPPHGVPAVWAFLLAWAARGGGEQRRNCPAPWATYHSHRLRVARLLRLRTESRLGH
eukprot:14648157-Alexandrium_andersonii.AAC.1